MGREYIDKECIIVYNDTIYKNIGENTLFALYFSKPKA